MHANQDAYQKTYRMLLYAKALVSSSATVSIGIVMPTLVIASDTAELFRTNMMTASEVEESSLSPFRFLIGSTSIKWISAKDSDWKWDRRIFLGLPRETVYLIDPSSIRIHHPQIIEDYTRFD